MSVCVCVYIESSKLGVRSRIEDAVTQNSAQINLFCYLITMTIHEFETISHLFRNYSLMIVIAVEVFNFTSFQHFKNWVLRKSQTCFGRTLRKLLVRKTKIKINKNQCFSNELFLSIPSSAAQQPTMYTILSPNAPFAMMLLTSWISPNLTVRTEQTSAWTLACPHPEELLTQWSHGWRGVWLRMKPYV